jgi:hypothetical protein
MPRSRVCDASDRGADASDVTRSALGVHAADGTRPRPPEAL